MPSPRVFLVRHGETEWSLSGRHTGRTDIPLTQNGERRVRATGRALVGSDRLIVPGKLVHVYVSPRQRAQRTLELLDLAAAAAAETTDAIREWDYGDYEGVTSADIHARQAAEPAGPPARAWDIWRDGCPGGESPDEVTRRVDGLIAQIRDRWHRPVMGGGAAAGAPGDVLVVAHGHVLRAFAMRWVGKTLQEGPALLLEAGGVGTLSYEHHNIDEPAILLGGAFVVDVADATAQ